MKKKEVAIVGAGITGLVCTHHLTLAGISSHIYEKSDRVGGRIATDNVDGFLLDKGFQVFLEGYDEVAKCLNISDLKLGYFDSGALLLDNNREITMGNPLVNPSYLLSSIGSEWATISDKWKMLVQLLSNSGNEVAYLGQSTADYLQEKGYSTIALRRFFRPFFGDVFLDRELNADAGFFIYIFSLFSRCRASLPQQGIQAIPSLIYNRLPSGIATFSTEAVAADLAKDYAWVVDTRPPMGTEIGYRSTKVIYFYGEVKRKIGPKLLVNVQDDLVRSACVISCVQPGYAPQGQDLVSVTLNPVFGGNSAGALKETVLSRMKEWFGKDSSLDFLAEYVVPNSLPASKIASNQIGFAISQNILLGGDTYTYPSMNGAALSGRKMAEFISSAN